MHLQKQHAKHFVHLLCQQLLKFIDMICTHITPQSNHVQVIIPDNYIGKRLEVIVFADDDTQEMPSKTGNIRLFLQMMTPKRCHLKLAILASTKAHLN